MEFVIPLLSEKPYRVSTPDELFTPCLLLFRDRLEFNIQRMGELLDSVSSGFGIESIWPHVKTHKSQWVTRKLMAAGFRGFKTTSEMVDGVTSHYSYTYDPMGRLRTVTEDGTLVEEYQYDSVGTRIYEMNVQRGIVGRSMTYDDEDHLLTAGEAVYLYDADGYLASRTVGIEPPYEVTSYVYSSRGELLRVNLPNGRVIEYVHDPLGRRIAKKVDEVITEKYLWQGLTRLLAVYDGTGNLLMRFLYADGRMPVAMKRGTALYYLTYDQVGTLRVVADGSGSVVKRVEYDSFGNILTDTNPTL